jgi:L-fuconolactonase
MNALSIVDSHVHLWNPTQLRYSWLDGSPALNRTFLPADFATASADSGVDKMVFVECGCEPAQNLAEAAWIEALAKGEPRLKGIVAHAPLEKGEAVRTELEALASCPLVKGIRRNLQGELDADLYLGPTFLAGLRLLADSDFTFDLCIRHDQLRSTTELVSRVPQVTFVLDHFGKPDVRGGQARSWARDLKALAALPNVVCKLSGLATEADWKHWQPADLEVYFAQALECFGFNRVLFGGDWPVATLATSYERWLETVRHFVSSAGEADQIKLFRGNAERIYHV